ncbi:MAG: hypothetical protein AAGH72_11650 [Verrucomicrobiota bacterium]
MDSKYIRKICEEPLPVKAFYWGRSSRSLGDYNLPQKTIIEISDPTKRGTGEVRCDLKILNPSQVELNLNESTKLDDPAVLFTATSEDIEKLTKNY